MNQVNQIDPTGRYGIGTAFITNVEAEPKLVNASVPEVTSVAPPPAAPSKPAVQTPSFTPSPYPTPFRCELCGISANRQDQLETHMRGAKHLKMLKQNGLPLPETSQ